MQQNHRSLKTEEKKLQPLKSTPKISVITPSYNQGRFVEKNIRSVLEQGYQSLEHIIIDGGSQDNSLEVIKKFQDQIAYWKSEPDSGQSAAINKGFRQATGDIFCWLNSDDYFEPGALQFVGKYFIDHPEIDMICGRMRVVDQDGNELNVQTSYYGGRHHLLQFWHGYAMHQPSIFWRRKIYQSIGGVNERLHLSMDYDYWLRIAERFSIANVDRILSSATAHAAQKTSDDFLGYKRAQLKDAIRHYGLPLRPKNYRLNFILYRHLLKLIIAVCCGRATIYHSTTTRMGTASKAKR